MQLEFPKLLGISRDALLFHIHHIFKRLKTVRMLKGCSDLRHAISRSILMSLKPSEYRAMSISASRFNDLTNNLLAWNVPPASAT